MRKINLESYKIQVKSFNSEKQVVEEVEQVYDVKTSCVDILLHPDLNLGGSELLISHKLAEKINECNDDKILLEENEYQRLKTAVEVLRGFSKKDVEFVDRILNAKEDIDVKEDN